MNIFTSWRQGNAWIGLVFSIALVALAWPGPGAWAQTGSGTVSGSVRDTNGGLVPGAAVTLTNTETSLVRKAETSPEGLYYFGAIPRGPYRITVEKQGFDTWASDFTLYVGQNAVLNSTLQVGSVTTVVQVSGAAPRIDTTGGTVSDVKDYNQIRDLPLNGRQIGNLFTLTPGVEGNAGGARVNGMKVGSLAITLDGVSEVDRFGGGMVRTQPGLETIQEFRIETTGSDARYGTPATVTLATRSGTNTLHGTLYEYHRNNSGGLAVRRRENPVGFQAPLLIRNEFGANAGGPVYIPHLYDGRNKSFWFADYEGLRDHENSAPLQPWVPTAAMWNGDLSNAVDVSSGQPIIVYNPLTTDASGNRQPYPNNQIPGPLSQIASVLKSLTALPSNNNNPYLAPNFTTFYPSIKSDNNLTFRGDQNISDKDRLSVRYTRSTTHAAVEGGYFANPINTSSGMGTSRRDYRIHNVAVNYSRTFSGNWLNELLAGVSRSNADYGTLADFTDWDQKLGLPNPFSVTGWPTLYTCEANGCSSYFGWDSDNRHNQALTSEVIDDNVTWTKGRHTIQFGGRALREQNNIRELQQTQGSHSFDPAYSVLFSQPDQAPVADTGSGFAELLLGLPDFLSNQYNRGYFYFRQTQGGLYAADRWKVNQRLTLDLGLRWDKWTPYHEAENRLVVPDTGNFAGATQVISPGGISVYGMPGIPPAVLSSWQAIGLSWTTASAVNYPPALFKAVNHDFGPRLGAAFKLNDKTVIRGAYGIYYFPMPLSLLLQSTRNNPPLNLRFVNNPYFKNAAVTYPYVVVPAASDYLPAATVNINTVQGLPPFGNGATIWDGRNWNDGREQTWNFTLERELPGRMALRLSYIGTWGQNLEQQFAINNQEPKYNYAVRTGLKPPSNSDLLRPNPFWSFIGINHTGYSHDNSAQVQIERRFGNGLGFQWFYTYSRALTTVDPGGFSDGNTGINSGGGGATVPEITDVIGEPNLSYGQRLKLAYFNNTNIPIHRMTFNAIYDLPFGRGKRFGKNVNGLLDQAIGGWQLATIGTWNSGFWMSPSAGLLQLGNVRIPAGKRPILNFGGDRQRLWFVGSFDPTQATNVTGGDLTSLIPTNVAQRTARPAGPNCAGKYVGQLAVQLANGACYNAPFGGLYNPSPRANIIGPGAWNDDLSLYKHFKAKERLDIRLAADFFNAFNHPNDVAPNATTGLQDLGFQNNAARIIQLSLRIDW